VKVRVERVLDGVAYATLVRALKKVPEPLTAEAEAEKPTRKPPARKGADSQAGTIEADDDDVDDAELEETDEGEDEDHDELEVAEPQAAEPARAERGPGEPDVAVPDVAAAVDGEATTPAKKKTRRGSRGGKNRKKPAGTTAAKLEAPEAEAEQAAGPKLPGPRPKLPQKEQHVTIHVPSADFGREDEAVAKPEPREGASAETPSENGAAAVAKKKTRRGSRGGKNRRKRTPAVDGSNGAEPAAESELVGSELVGSELVEAELVAAELEVGPAETVSAPAETAEEPSTNGAPEDEWGYVPMSEWVDELES
jgi:hypothetical protein